MKKLISSILLVTGTSIGGGLILLPAIIGVYGYFSAIMLLTAVWFFNTLIALIFLEANCYLPVRTSLISMSKELLTHHFKWITWVICLGFLYTIMCVYISGMTEIISGFLEKKSLLIPSFYLSIASVIIISLPIYFGMVYINYFNRFVVISMFLAFFMLVFFLLPHSDIHNFLSAAYHIPLLALPVVFTSFGFLIVIPTLRSYLDDNIKKIKIAIVIGSFIPLVIYILWTTVVMGVIPISGDNSLQAILDHAEPIKQMTSTLILNTRSTSISFFAQSFILFSVVSSFVGISLGLYDFLADGLKISKTPWGKIKLLTLTFLPPLSIVLTQNRLFLSALGFAGLISTVLFGLYPVMLAWSGRYIRKRHTHYRVSMNRLVLLLIVIFCVVIIGVEVSILSKSSI